MDRKRSFVMAGGTVLMALGAGQYMQSGTAQSSAAMMPVPRAEVTEVTIVPRVAAATPLSGYTPSPQMQATPVALTKAPTSPTPKKDQPETLPLSDLCPVTLDAFAAADAMLSLSLSAPCHPNQTVVVQHGGLSVTYLTTATGALFADIPALESTGALTIRMPDGAEARASAPVPELAAIRRLAVQWMVEDRFSLSGDGALVTLGTMSGPAPMLAQVITLPSAAGTPPAIEAEVTRDTCGRELLGEVLYSELGRVTRADLSIAMPDCDGMGGFVALNNPIPDMKLAATD